MKKSTIFITTLLFLFVLNSCSKEEANNSPDEYQITTQANITSFSKNFGYTDETVTIFGENFTTNASSVSVKFDNVPAIVVSATNTEIKCILPAITNKIPVLTVTIPYRNIYNTVVNDYNGNIGILPKRVYNSWLTSESILPYIGGKIYKTVIIDSKKLYCHIDDNFGGAVFRTIDDGITWKRWSSCPGGSFGGGFYVSTNDSGFSNSGFGLSKVQVGGNNLSSNIVSNVVLDAVCINSKNDLSEVTSITTRGNVYESQDGGVNFSQTYSSTLNILISPNTILGQLDNSDQVDKNHIWAGGSMRNSSNYSFRKPVIVYKNQEIGEWKEYIFPQIDNEYGRIVQLNFIDVNNGFTLVSSGITAQPDVKLFKTTNGGDNWSQVYSNEKFSYIAFKDVNTGWAILENKIYKTVNGGSSWQVDFTNDTNILNITYKENMVLAISNNKIIRYYFQ